MFKSQGGNWLFVQIILEVTMLQGSCAKMFPHWRFQEVHDDHMKCKLQHKIHTATSRASLLSRQTERWGKCRHGSEPPWKPRFKQLPSYLLLPCMPLRAHLPSRHPRETPGDMLTREPGGRVSALGQMSLLLAIAAPLREPRWNPLCWGARYCFNYHPDNSIPQTDTQYCPWWMCTVPRSNIKPAAIIFDQEEKML